MKHRLLTAAALIVPAMASAQPGQLDAARLRAHVQTLGSDAYRRPRADDAGRDQDGRLFDRAIARRGGLARGSVVNGKRGWTQDVPLLKSDHAAAPAIRSTSRARGH